MKKLIGVCLLAVMMSGCSNSKSGTMVCESNVNSDMMESSVKQSIVYEDEKVIRQVNETQLTIKNTDTYDQVMAIIDNASNVYKDIVGATYSHEKDEEKLFVSERVELEIAKMNAEDIKKVISYDIDENLNIDEIKDVLQEQGYTCKK